MNKEKSVGLDGSETQKLLDISHPIKFLKVLY